jgi:glycosyltransferase involved in cell wall biosynthesis
MLQTCTPLVSVCIPTYRGAEHLGAAIESVLAQSLTDFELLIIDDNSPDATGRVVARYQDPRIRFLRNPSNLGPEGNWNKCLTESLGTYIKLLPQDDLLAPTCLEQQVAVLERDGEQRRIALVFCARTIIDAEGRALITRRYAGGSRGVISGQSLIRRCVRYGTNLIGEPGSVLFRRELATAVGSFDAIVPYVIDLDYWFRLLLKGDAYYIPDPLVSFRVSPGSWSVAIGTRQGEEFCRFIKKIAKNSDYKLTRLDVVIDQFMARLNNYLRLLFYHSVLKRG